MSENKIIPPLPADARAETLRLWNALEIKPAKLGAVDKVVSRLMDNAQAYRKLEQITGVPWWVIGCLHYREGNFAGHLHNGDPLSARTRNVPAGRPPGGLPPFTFHDSALDALEFDGLAAWRDWSLPGALWAMESFNGFGYRRLQSPLPSPYLWAFSVGQPPGKFVRDGVLDRNATDAQAGVAVLLWRMERLGLVDFKAVASPAQPSFLARLWRSIGSLFAPQKEAGK